MLPFLFGSLSKWLTSKKQAPRAERRAEQLKIKKQVKRLELENLEERITPTVRLYTDNTLATLINTFNTPAAIDNALAAAAAGNAITVDNDESYSEFRSTGSSGLGANLNIIIRPNPTLTTAGAPIVVDATGTYGAAAFIASGATNITIRGLTFSNANGLPGYIGIKINPLTSGINIENDVVQNLSRGIEVGTNVNGVSIVRNDIKNNSGEGVAFIGGATDNITFTNNFIRGNAFGTSISPFNETLAAGVRFQNNFGTSTPSSNTFRNNFFENNGNFGAVRNATTGPGLQLLDFSGSWWGTNAGPTISTSGSPGAANNNRISIAPLPPLTTNAAVDYTPWLNVGTDTDLVTPGFQGSHAFLHVDDDSPQFGSTGRIQEGINLASLAGTVFIHNGLYKESNSTISQAVTVTGESQAGVVVVPQAEDDNLNTSFTGTVQTGFLVASSNVNISNLTIDGQGNASLTAGKNNFRSGIITPNDSIDRSNLSFTNMTVKNIYRRAIQITYAGDNNAITGNTITQNSGALAPPTGAYGTGSAGIMVFGPIGTVTLPTLIANNTITNTIGDGIATNSGALLIIRNNTITNTPVGIDASLLAAGSVIGGPTAGTAGVGGTGNGNLINMNGSGQIGVIGYYFATSIPVQNNVINGSNADSGIDAFFNSVPVLIVGNTLTSTTSTSGADGQGTGIYITDALFGEGTAPGHGAGQHHFWLLLWR